MVEFKLKKCGGDYIIFKDDEEFKNLGNVNERTAYECTLNRANELLERCGDDFRYWDSSVIDFNDVRDKLHFHDLGWDLEDADIGFLVLDLLNHRHNACDDTPKKQCYYSLDELTRELSARLGEDEFELIKNSVNRYFIFKDTSMA